MSKTVNFEYEGRTYRLGFNRKTVKQMESEGFNFEEFKTKPLSCISDLFAGAFRLNHRFTKRELIDEIHASLKDKEGLNQALMDMYSETLTSLMSNADDEETENLISWSVAEQ